MKTKPTIEQLCARYIPLNRVVVPAPRPVTLPRIVYLILGQRPSQLARSVQKGRS